MNRYEAYYVDRQNRLPLPAVYVHRHDPKDSIFYIDLKNGRTVESYSRLGAPGQVALSGPARLQYPVALPPSASLGCSSDRLSGRRDMVIDDERHHCMEKAPRSLLG